MPCRERSRGSVVEDVCTPPATQDMAVGAGCKLGLLVMVMMAVMAVFVAPVNPLSSSSSHAKVTTQPHFRYPPLV